MQLPERIRFPRLTGTVAYPEVAVSRRRLLARAAGGGVVLAGGLHAGIGRTGIAQSQPAFPPISVRQPQPDDIVDDPILVCGIGTGFEGTFAAWVQDAAGGELARVSILAGGSRIRANFHTELRIGPVPATPHGTLEVFEFSARDGLPINVVTIPVVFGRALIDPYHGFALHTVTPGETLLAITRQWYGDATYWRALFEANRQQLADPDQIFPGQVLRVPQ